MLVLVRKKGESIVIGDSIRITIREISGSNKVTVGIEAPLTTPVARQELFTAEQLKVINDKIAQLTDKALSREQLLQLEEKFRLNKGEPLLRRALPEGQ